jgi:hypothetical protein
MAEMSDAADMVSGLITLFRIVPIVIQTIENDDLGWTEISKEENIHLEINYVDECEEPDCSSSQM